MKKYYTEEIVLDASHRKEYAEGIDQFLFQKKEKIDKIRSSYITPEQYIENSDFYREEFIKMLGFPLVLSQETPSLKSKVFVAQDGNVNIYRIQLTFFNSIDFYGLYFEQVQAKQDAPFVIGLHGGGGTPELAAGMHWDSGNYNHLIRRITDRGANVFAPQLLLWEKQHYGGTFDVEQDKPNIDAKLRQLGGSLVALELYFLRGSISYFIEQEQMNAQKIGVAGLSYGGMYALHLAAVDERIKACYSCSWVNDSFIYSWPQWSYQGAQQKFTTVEIAALISPRKLVIAMGKDDSLFKSKNTIQTCEKIMPYYTKQGKEYNFQYIIFDGVHEADTSDCEIDFLFRAFEK